jgi:transposase
MSGVKERADDRQVISGILHALRSGCRWKDCPSEYGPHTTIYNRFTRWAEQGVWEHLFRELAERGRSTATQMIDSTHIKAHRSASGGKGASRNKRLAVHAAGAIRRSMHSQMLMAVFFPSPDRRPTALDGMLEQERRHERSSASHRR